MFHKLLILIAMIFASKTVLASEETDHTYAFEYTTETYPIEMAKGNHFVVFYNEGCSLYRRLKPTWELLAKGRNYIKNGQVWIAVVECIANAPVCVGNKIPGHPTIRFFKAGNSSGIEYTGALTLESFNNFIDLQLQ